MSKASGKLWRIWKPLLVWSVVALITTFACQPADADPTVTTDWVLNDEQDKMDSTTIEKVYAEYTRDDGGKLQFSFECIPSPVNIDGESNTKNAITVEIISEGMPFLIKQNAFENYVQFRFKLGDKPPRPSFYLIQDYNNVVDMDFVSDSLEDLMTSKTLLFELPFQNGKDVFEVDLQNPVLSQYLQSCSGAPSVTKPENSTPTPQTTVPPAQTTMPPASPSQQRASFDCTLADSVIEDTICADPELTTRDATMGKLYHELRSTLKPTESLSVRDYQRKWLRDRLAYCNVPENGRGAITDGKSLQCLIKEYDNIIQYYQGEIALLKPTPSPPR